MRIKILKCTKPTFWYKDKVGEEYIVVRAVAYPNNAGYGFEVKTDGLKKYVDEIDAEIIFEKF